MISVYAHTRHYCPCNYYILPVNIHCVHAFLCKFIIHEMKKKDGKNNYDIDDRIILQNFLFPSFLLFVVTFALYYPTLYIIIVLHEMLGTFNSTLLSAVFSIQRCNHSGKRETEIYSLALSII